MRLYALAATSVMAVAWASAVDTASYAAEAEAFFADKLWNIVPAPASVLQPDLAAITAAALAGNYTSKLRDTTRMLCPSACSAIDADSHHWFAYSDVSRLNQCNETMLVDFSLLSDLSNPRVNNKIFACTADLNASSRTASKTTTCPYDMVNRIQVTSSMQMVSSRASSGADLVTVANALAQLQASYERSEPSCNEMVDFAYSTKAAVGVYVGSRLASQGVINSVLHQLSAALNDDGGVPESVAVQLCDNRSSRYSLGVFISTKANLSAAQHALQTWKNGSCLTTMDKAVPTWHNITFLAPSLVQNQNGTAASGNSTPATPSPGKKLSARDACRTVQVHAGDSCGSLAAECGITPAQFTKYNPAADECSTLRVGEYVCCSGGTLPNYQPKPDKLGNCFPYEIVSGDTCPTIAAAHDITVSDIESFNHETWGFAGCSSLFIGDLICLSNGYPPMPAPLANAICGPQVKGTPPAAHGTNFSLMNECPLNACCNVWGQCGTTDDFCSIAPAATHNPGTSAPGINSCISNCGVDIITTVPGKPWTPYSIAYFQGNDWARACLNGGAQNLNTSAYTHVHFAFATINPDWSINTTAIDPQLPFLRDLQGVKKIISIGGWDFSTDPSTYMIFREVTREKSSRATLISNIIAFLKTNNLDGVDIDWEYPGAPDIPGIPPGDLTEGLNFLSLLDELKQSIAANATGKTISITAPASYWYLQHFPIYAISLIVDYLVYMTYDLHGQWDYGKPYSDPGCPSGLCPYDGPASGALPGPCTDVAGILANYEIDLVIAENPSATLHWDEGSYSNILVYNQTQWGAYQNDTTKALMTRVYIGLGFMGTSDWAADLQSGFSGDIDTTPDLAASTVYINPAIWARSSAELTMPPGATLIWPPKPLATPTTISFPLWTTTVTYSSLTTLTSTLNHGSTSTYLWYINIPVATVITIPPVTTTAIPIWGVSLGTDAGHDTATSSLGGLIYLTSSVQPRPFPVTITPVLGGTTSIISPTATTTSPGAIFTWGSQAESLPPTTETLGARTTIIGGTTLLPVVVTVTPNPHPTQTQSTPDPELNTASISWKPPPPPGGGSPPGPGGILPPGPPGPPWAISLPGCKGCGWPCFLFCFSGCPFCPPGMFPGGSGFNIGPGGGGGDGGGDGGDDGNDPSTTASTSSPTATATVGVAATGGGDVFPTDPLDMSALIALESVQISMWNSLHPDHLYGSTTTTAPPPPSSQPPARPTPPAPTANCNTYDDSGLAYRFEVFNILGWATDHGAELHHQESGCGALTFWDWSDATSTEGAKAYFDLPLFLKAGCVERAIATAGGPHLQCQRQFAEARKRSLGLHAAAAAAPSHSQLTDDELKMYALRIIYGNNTGPHQPYVPMNWTALDSL